MTAGKSSNAISLTVGLMGNDHFPFLKSAEKMIMQVPSDGGICLSCRRSDDQDGVHPIVILRMQNAVKI